MSDVSYPTASLPGIATELRLRIFELVLEESLLLPARAITRVTPTILHSLTLVCRLFRRDLSSNEIHRITDLTIPVNMFYFRGVGDLQQSTTNIVARHKSNLVRKICIKNLPLPHVVLDMWLYDAAAWSPLLHYSNLRYLQLSVGLIDSITLARGERWLDIPEVNRQRRYTVVAHALQRNLPQFSIDLVLEIVGHISVDRISEGTAAESSGSIVYITLKYMRSASGTWQMSSAPNEREVLLDVQ